MPVKWETITERDCEALPEATPPRPADPDWEAVLDALEAGQHVRLPYEEGQNRRGLALAVGRRAAGRGFKVELRHGEDFLAARKSGEVAPEPQEEELAGEVQTRRGDGRRRGGRRAASLPANPEE
jgi:hypothetical protein